MASSKKTQQAKPLPSLRRYISGLSNMSPEQQKRILDAQHARSLAIAAMPDKGMLGPSAKNKYLWVGTNLEDKVKKQAVANAPPAQSHQEEVSEAESWLENRTNFWRENDILDKGRPSHSGVSIRVPLERVEEFDFEF